MDLSSLTQLTELLKEFNAIFAKVDFAALFNALAKFISSIDFSALSTFISNISAQ